MITKLLRYLFPSYFLKRDIKAHQKKWEAIEEEANKRRKLIHSIVIKEIPQQQGEGEEVK